MPRELPSYPHRAVEYYLVTVKEANWPQSVLLKVELVHGILMGLDCILNMLLSKIICDDSLHRTLLESLLTCLLLLSLFGKKTFASKVLL